MSKEIVRIGDQHARPPNATGLHIHVGVIFCYSKPSVALTLQLSVALTLQLSTVVGVFVPAFPIVRQHEEEYPVSDLRRWRHPGSAWEFRDASLSKDGDGTHVHHM